MNLFSKRKTRKNPHGFVVLNIALIVGAIGILVALGIVSATMFQTQTISSRQDALLAQTNAETCIEKAIYELTKDIHLYGSYVYYLDNGGKCEYFYISGTGNTNRVIQSRAVVGTSTRLKEARIIQVRPVLRLAYVKDISTLSEIEVVRGENLALWLSAQDTSALSLSGETMRTWLDKSLLKNNVSQDQKEKQPTYVSRIDNRPGVFFNGTNNLLEGQDSLSLRISGEISLSAWVRINPTNESSHKIIQKNHPSGHSEHSSYALAITRSVENYRVDLHTQSCDGLALKAEGPIIQGNKWVHVLVTYSEVEELAKFYVNGGLATEVAHSGLICDGVGGTVEIGSNSTNNEWFDGYIDDIRLYNRAVNSDDVFKIYMQTIPSHILTVALSNLSLWFDPSEYETLTIESNDKVSSWKDRIRDTVFLSQNADSNRPLYTQSVGGKEGLDFDGTQTYLSMPTDPSIELTDEITISAWIRPRQGGGNSKLVHKKSTTNSTTNSLYALILEEDNSVAFRTFDCPGNTNTFVGPEIPINKWSHVTATYSNTLDTVRIFLDGKLTHFNANYTGEICNEEGNFEIGGFSNHAIDKWFDGFIGEIRLYDAALSDQHIRAIYDETFRQLNIPANWYDSSWSHRNVITIDSNQVVEDLTNFPVLINSTREEWKHAGSGGNVGKSDGTDILFTSEDGQTKLDHEIEKFDGVTGELVAWVRAPFLPGSVDTEIYMYYGNVDAENQQNAAGVWDSNYVGVWHLKENPAGTAPQMLDSTTNVNHGTSGGSMTSGDQIAGKIGGSLNFDGTNDVIRVPNSPSTDITGNQFTLSAWVYPTDIGCGNSSCDEGIISKAHEGTSNAERYHLGLNRTGSISVRRFSGTQNFGPSTADVVVNNGWQYLVGRYDGSTLKAYYNGNEVGSTGASGNIDSSVEDLLFGKRYDNRFHTGRIDEIRVSNVARSAGWITTEYNNQNSPGTFYSLETEESL